MDKKTNIDGEGVVTRVSSNDDYINFRVMTDDHKLIIDVKFKLEDWATASTCLMSPCVVVVEEKGE